MNGHSSNWDLVLTMNSKVRTATTNDAFRIAEIHVNAWKAAYVNFMNPEILGALSVSEREEMWKAAIGNKGLGSCVVFEIEGAIQGFCFCGPARDTDLDNSACELIAINVNPECWGSGIGRALMEHALESTKQEQYSTLHLWVIEGNCRAIRLYKGYGFKDLGVRKVDSTYSDNPIHEIRYTKTLD